MRKLLFVIVLGFASLTTNVYAVDGVIEISNVTHIKQPGSYVLVNDIVVPNKMGMWIMASDVTLDLNGFSIRSGNGGVLDGLVINTTITNVEVKNGSIVGFPRYGVFAPAGPNPLANNLGLKLTNLRVRDNRLGGIQIQSRPGAMIQDSIVSNNGGSGIRIGAAALLVNNVIFNNASRGLWATSSSAGYRSNVFYNNGSGDVAGGRNLGENLCSGVICP